MSFESHHDRMLGSCMSYSKLGKRIEDLTGVPFRYTAGSSRGGDVIHQIMTAISEESRRAGEEGVRRGYSVAAKYLPEHPEEGLYIPDTEVLINSGNVGWIKVRPFRSVAQASIGK